MPLSAVPVAIFSPVAFGEAGGKPFATEVDALVGGFSAWCDFVPTITLMAFQM
jgi:hypothetical protein